MTYLLRLVLPDRPGSLGAVATALGKAGVDIETLDVVERGPEGAVDDLVVRVPPGGLADTLISAAHSVAGVRVEALRPHPRAAETVRDLDIVDALAAEPHRALRRLVTMVPEAFTAAWAMVIEVGERGDPCVAVASPAAPHDRGFATPWLPLDGARRLGDDEPWVPARWVQRGVEMAAVPVTGPACALLVGRVGGPVFRPSEVVRLAHLAGIAGTVVRSFAVLPAATLMDDEFPAPA